MSFGWKPLLKQGPMALYYGGEDIMSQVSDEPFVEHYDLLASLSLVVQMILFIFKRVKDRKLMSVRQSLRTVLGKYLH